MLGERGRKQQGIRVVELNGLTDLIEQGCHCLDMVEVKKLDHSKDKWIKYYLTNEELALLERLNTDQRISNATELYEVNVGLVSGENNFFVVNRDVVEDYNLQDSVIPIISRSEQVKGIRLTTNDYSDLVTSGKKVFFFAPGNSNIEDLSKAQIEYIHWGEEHGYNKNYKCRIRSKWYHVPQTWRADAFLLRQVHLYPRMVLNEKQALVTDTLHKVRFLEGIRGESVASAFLNTYTFALIRLYVMK